jgi:hypothetical protein
MIHRQMVANRDDSIQFSTVGSTADWRERIPQWLVLNYTETTPSELEVFSFGYQDLYAYGYFIGYTTEMGGQGDPEFMMGFLDGRGDLAPDS